MNRAERTYEKSVDLLNVQMEHMLKSMTDAVATFRADKQRSLYCVEMGVVLKRQRWLQCLMNSDAQTLEKLIGDTADKDAGDHSDSGSSKDNKDLTALIRAGPCENFEKLVPFDTFLKHKGGARLCDSMEALSTWSSAMADHKKVYATFLKACGGAVNDLYQARTERKKTADEKQKLEQAAASTTKKQAETKQVAARKKVVVSGIPMLNLESPPDDDAHAIDVGATFPALCDLSVPRVVTDQEWIKCVDEVIGTAAKSPLREFVEGFDGSSIKITQGRCQLYIAEQVLTDRVVQHLESEVGAPSFCNNDSSVKFIVDMIFTSGALI